MLRLHTLHQLLVLLLLLQQTQQQLVNDPTCQPSAASGAAHCASYS
jgi:hypothetical protein